MSDVHRHRGDEPLHLGLYPATVQALEGDPDDRGRVEVSLDWLAGTDDGEAPRAWATLLSPYADDDQGFQMLPEIGSAVVVGFQAGHLDAPYVVGAVWNGNESPPETFSDRNDIRTIKTRSGSALIFDDTEGSVKVQIDTPSGHRITLDDGASDITIEASSGATIVLNPAGGIEIQATSTVDVTAAMVSVDAAMSEFSGVVTCQTLVAKSGVVSPSYTPGAGNVW